MFYSYPPPPPPPGLTQQQVQRQCPPHSVASSPTLNLLPGLGQGISLHLDFLFWKWEMIPPIVRIKWNRTIWKGLDEVNSWNTPRGVVWLFYLSHCVTAGGAKYFPIHYTMRKQDSLSVKHEVTSVTVPGIVSGPQSSSRINGGPQCFLSAVMKLFFSQYRRS